MPLVTGKNACEPPFPHTALGPGDRNGPLPATRYCHMKAGRRARRDGGLRVWAGGLQVKPSGGKLRS